jgi:hypothetical protein
MSGRKKALVSVDRGALQRIRELVERRRYGRIDFAPAEGSEDSSAASAAAGADLKSAIDSTSERIAALESQLSGANTEIQRLEIQSASRALEAAETLAASASQDYRVALDAARDEWAGRLERERQERRAELAEIWETVESLEARDQARHEIAADFLDAAERLLDFIHEYYDPNMIDAVQYDSFLGLLERTGAALEHDMPEAAYTSAERAYLGLSEMRLALEEAEMLQVLLRQRVRDHAAALQAAVDAAAWVRPVDFEGNELVDEEPISVDYWSENARLRLVHRVENLVERVCSEDFETASLDELEHLNGKTIPDMEKALDKCVSDALLEVIYAQVRANITEMALHALQTQGFTITKNSITETSDRRGCRLTLEGPGEVGVDMKVSRMNSDHTASQLEMHYTDAADLTPYEINRRTSEINLALQKNGIDVEKMIVFQPAGPGGRTRPVDLTDRLKREQPVVVRTPVQ